MPRSWEDYIASEEAAHEEACLQCAKWNGHTAQEAENCDAGSVGCPDCPFKIRIKTRKKRVTVTVAR